MTSVMLESSICQFQFKHFSSLVSLVKTFEIYNGSFSTRLGKTRSGKTEWYQYPKYHTIVYSMIFIYRDEMIELYFYMNYHIIVYNAELIWDGLLTTTFIQLWQGKNKIVKCLNWRPQMS